MSLEEKLNNNKISLLSKINNYLKKSLTIKIVTYSIAGTIAFGVGYSIFNNYGCGKDERIELKCQTDNDCSSMEDYVCRKSDGVCCPSKKEVCDGIDNDCDNLIDEDLDCGCKQDSDCQIIDKIQSCVKSEGNLYGYCADTCYDHSDCVDGYKCMCDAYWSASGNCSGTCVHTCNSDTDCYDLASNLRYCRPIQTGTKYCSNCGYTTIVERENKIECD